jgi:hypothetical protein
MRRGRGSVPTGAYFANVATNHLRRLVVRPEHDEWELLKKRPELFDAVLLPESYVSPYSVGHHFGGNPPARLAEVAQEQGLPHWRDPETPGLCSRTILQFGATTRRRRTPLANAFELPLDITVFERPDARRHALELVLSTQASCETVTGPYFSFDRRDSPGHRLNLLFSAEIARSSAGQIPTAIVQVTRHRLLTGLPAEVAVDYAGVGAKRVILRVRGLKPEYASVEELSALLDALTAFRRRHVQVFVDCAGDLGPVLIAGGADGFTTGTRFFRSVAAAVLSAGGGGGAAPIEARIAGSWVRTERPAEQTAEQARVENIEVLRELTDLAAEHPEALIERLLKDPAPQAAVWGAVLKARKLRVA